MEPSHRNKKRSIYREKQTSKSGFRVTPIVFFACPGCREAGGRGQVSAGWETEGVSNTAPPHTQTHTK